MAGIIEVKDQGVLRIYDADNSNYVDIVVPSTVSSNRTITIPDASFTIPNAVGDGGLTTNDFTDADHTKLDGIAASANNYVHPNHSGEVTSTADGATVIADNIVDEANLKISNSPTNGYFLSAQSGNTGGLTWAEVAAGGITGADFWRLNTDVNFGADQQVLDSNWERVDTDGYGVIGSAMTESSGIFTFPTTGIWQIIFQAAASRQSSQDLKATYFRIQTTTNNSSYSTASQGVLEHDGFGVASSCCCSFIFDVTNTSNCKIRTEQYETQGSASNVNVLGGTADTVTGISFIRLADT